MSRGVKRIINYIHCPITIRRPSSLPLHQVRPVAVAQGEPGAEVGLEVCREAGKDGGVHRLLVGNPLSRNSVLLKFILEEISLATLRPLLLLSLEVRVIKLADVNLADIDLGGGRDDVAGVHTADGNSRELEGSSDKEQSRRELSKAHHPLSSKPSSEEDQDGSRGDGSPKLGLSAGKLALERLAHILSRVELRLGLGNDLLGGLRVDWQLSSILLLDGPNTTATRESSASSESAYCGGLSITLQSGPGWRWTPVSVAPPRARPRVGIRKTGVGQRSILRRSNGDFLRPSTSKGNISFIKRDGTQRNATEAKVGDVLALQPSGIPRSSPRGGGPEQG